MNLETIKNHTNNSMDQRMIHIRRVQQLQLLEQIKKQDANININTNLSNSINSDSNIQNNAESSNTESSNTESSNTGSNVENNTEHKGSDTLSNVEEKIKTKIVEVNNLNNSIINVPGIKGLRNLGNSCYMNSILQILFNTYGFKNMIINSDMAKNLYPFVTKNINLEDTKNYSLIVEKCIKT